MASDTGFSRFEYGESRVGEPMLSIYRRGQARFNVHAVRLWLEDVDRVEFYTDPATLRLGIALGGRGQHSYSLSRSGRGGREVSASKVLGEFGIDAENLTSGVKCPLEYDEDEGLVIADLEPVVDALDGDRDD